MKADYIQSEHKNLLTVSALEDWRGHMHHKPEIVEMDLRRIYSALRNLYLLPAGFDYRQRLNLIGRGYSGTYLIGAMQMYTMKITIELIDANRVEFTNLSNEFCAWGLGQIMGKGPFDSGETVGWMTERSEPEWIKLLVMSVSLPMLIRVGANVKKNPAMTFADCIEQLNKMILQAVGQTHFKMRGDN